MTDRHKGYVVTLKDDIREDDAEKIIAALSMVNGVLSVDPVTQDAGGLISDARAWSKMRDLIVKYVLEMRP